MLSYLSRLLKILFETFNPQQVAFSNRRRYCAITAGGNLHEEV